MAKALAIRSDVASLNGEWFGTRFEFRPTSFLAAPGCGPFICLSVRSGPTSYGLQAPFLRSPFIRPNQWSGASTSRFDSGIRLGTA